MITLVKTKHPGYARSISFFWWKWILLGTDFASLPPDEQLATLAHEEGHCELHHTEYRLLFLLVPIFWIMFFEFCKEHEFEADEYSAARGNKQALLKLLANDWDGGLMHPSNATRRARLEQYEYLRTAPVTS
jgi:Zn-dependent protease with chaperone function